MSCCCWTVSYHLVVNLVDRFSELVRDLIYCRCRNCTGSSLDEDADQQSVHSGGGVVNSCVVADKTEPGEISTIGGRPRYVLLNDTVELQPFYYDVDRRQCELLLKDRPDGTCLVRPFKLKHETIRYILSIRAAETYFHLFIRHAGNNGMYALGLEKQHEKRFKFASDIVHYYQLHSLECTRATAVIAKLKLSPLHTPTGEQRPQD
ncbi:uncharacterized protein LOC126569519 [Anopheles aquasalis]|uniref:uncharacterized protein LOC126569519 n=1 Tax=Anopheles aquasalis TaxID=42839 RepID=UPI00215A47FB|nr:uncharacterized protein LOC126569519 [Anopheles aquasalis]